MIDYSANAFHQSPYRIVYYIKPDQIDVLAVIHAAQDVFRER